MEPQDIYRQRLDTDYERSSFRLHAYEQEKIKEQKYKGNFLLTSIMQVVFIILSAFYFFISSSASPRINSLLINFPLLINFLSINIFFFLVAQLLPRKLIYKNRRVLFTCFIFLTTLILFFVSLIEITEARNFGALFLTWIIAMLLDLATYWVAKSAPLVQF